MRELSCDLPVPVVPCILPEEKLLKKLAAASVDEDTVNFIRAKEQFKATLKFPGILFRWVDLTTWLAYLLEVTLVQSTSSCLGDSCISLCKSLGFPPFYIYHFLSLPYISD